MLDLPAKLNHHILPVSVVPPVLTVIFLIVLQFSFPHGIQAQSLFNHTSGSAGDACLLAPLRSDSNQRPNTRNSTLHSREDRCIEIGRWVGAGAGSFMGFAQMYWSATGVSGVYGPFWKNCVTGIPSVALGSYVGAKTTKWATRMIMKGRPKPAKAALKGMLYGAIDGTVTLTVSFIPLLLIGHYADTIHFNMSDDLIALKLIGASALGGMVYGGTYGAVAGAVGGPCISMYVKY